MSSETTQVIYSMNRVGRFVPPNKQILRDISLGFYYGAKIGVLGLNGAGKSTLLRIMAGLDNDYTGEIARSPGYTTGLLAQEPVLDETKTVIEVVKEAVQPIVAEVDALKMRTGESIAWGKDNVIWLTSEAGSRTRQPTIGSVTCDLKGLR